jgi:hypothetical protein
MNFLGAVPSGSVVYLGAFDQSAYHYLSPMSLPSKTLGEGR